MTKEIILEYLIIKEMRLIIEYFSGKIYYDDYIKFKNIQSQDENYNPTYNQLLDLRDSELMIDGEQVNNAIQYFKQNKHLLANRRVAVLTSEPNHVIVTTLAILNNDTPINNRVFSTVEKAIEFIGYSILEKNKIENLIQQIKTQPNTL